MSDWMIEDTREPREYRRRDFLGFTEEELEGADLDHDDVNDVEDE